MIAIQSCYRLSIALLALSAGNAFAQQSNEQYYQEQMQQQRQAHAAEMNRQGYLQQQQAQADQYDPAYDEGQQAQPAAPAMPLSEAMDILSKPPSTYGAAADARAAREAEADDAAGAGSPQDPPQR